MGNLLFDTGTLQACQGSLKASGHSLDLAGAPWHCHSVCWSRRANRQFTATSWQTATRSSRPKLSTGTADTRAITEEPHLNQQYHLKRGGKMSTHKSCKGTTDSPPLYLPPKIHQHLDRTSGLLPRRAPSRHRSLVKTYQVHTMTHNRSCGSQPAPRLRAFLLEKVTEDLKKP